MEPWLDSLSEDWNSEPRSSSPATSRSGHSNRGNQSFASQQSSRIPHLAQSLRNGSINGNYLKPRSSRGIARSQTAPVLAERSPSSLNVLKGGLPDTLERRYTSSTYLKRAPSSLSDSQQSVQHHSVRIASDQGTVPEWKRKLANGEDVAREGFDLFAPIKLEGIFQQSSAMDEVENTISSVASDKKPWNALNNPLFPPPKDQHHSYRASRARPASLYGLQDVIEEEEDDRDLSIISSDILRDGSLRGLVGRRVDSIEKGGQTAAQVSEYQDPRVRTISGQKEIEDEYISPITASRQNTIREHALKDSLEVDDEMDEKFKKKIRRTSSNEYQRPSSSSSDRDVSYHVQGQAREPLLHEEPLEDMTSQSLPEDLSMGTQEFVSNGGYVNQRRGGPSFDMSFMRRKPSLSVESSLLDPSRVIPSSPPRAARSSATFKPQPPVASQPPEDIDDSVIHHGDAHESRSATASPLKLFGNRDTYTNNKLLRVLSQFEQESSEHSIPTEEEHVSDLVGQVLRMSQFGQGELDDFNFDQEVHKPLPKEFTDANVAGKIFQPTTHLSLRDDHAQTKSITDPSMTNKSKSDGEIPIDHSEEDPPSSLKERTTKRRRTLLRDEIEVDGVDMEIKIDRLVDNTLAGKKRKDARPGEEGEQADPDVLATRSIALPVSASRRPSMTKHDSTKSIGVNEVLTDPAQKLTEALAAELESFAKGASEAIHDSRKPSLATKDYMEEANKVMQFIRARGKPKLSLPEIEEPSELSELDPDAISDLDIDNESTKDSFSRPPSRERPSKPQEDRRHAKHNERLASHLKKFQDPDELELLASTSALGTLHLVDNRQAFEASLVPVPDDEQESSPPNMRITNQDDNLRKRKYSNSTVDPQDLIETHQSSEYSSKQSFVTGSSASSRQKGVITSGTIQIPDHVGKMTFDHEKRIWIKQEMAKESSPQHKAVKDIRKIRQTASEADPFEDIPDLSIDEQKEATMRVEPRSSSSHTSVLSGSLKDKNISADVPADSQRYQSADNDDQKQSRDLGLSSSQPRGTNKVSSKDMSLLWDKRPSSQRSEISKHEELLHEGIASYEPLSNGVPQRKPRVVTIAFSSPIAEEIPYHQPPSVSDADIDEDDPSFLPLDDDSVFVSSPVRESKTFSSPMPSNNVPTHHTFPLHPNRHQHYRAMTLNRRPVSRIEEHDEDQTRNDEMSLIQVLDHNKQTPAPQKYGFLMKHSDKRESSILCLTPLSEFTLHQAEAFNHPEESYVAERANPKTLLQAHGSHALTVDYLMKVITDTQPTEVFWDKIQHLDLSRKGLSTLHGLQDFCSTLEELCAAGNDIGHLNGLPSTLRSLDFQQNCLTDLTSWGHLFNLQYVNVSGNNLESLDCFNGLVHLRELNANNNHVRDFDGILDLTGLITLCLGGNELAEISFDGARLLRLEHLDVSNNKLTKVECLEALPGLKRINLTCNKLKAVNLPVQKVLPGLKSLLLAHNELERIDISAFPALNELDLDCNSIKMIDHLSDAANLQTLSIREQRNSPSIANLIFTTPNECNTIRLSSNLIASGQPLLPQLPHYNLRVLELAGCGLKSLDPRFGDFFPNCRSLNLNFNAIQDLSPLFGTIKLRHLLIAQNRLKRLRRTCLALSRLQSITKLDIRDNPLTVGCYSPLNKSTEQNSPYCLPNGCKKLDVKWLALLDDTTRLRRRMLELLLAEKCKNLSHLDGLDFCPADIMQVDETWHSLTQTGVLSKSIHSQPIELHGNDLGSEVDNQDRSPREGGGDQVNSRVRDE